MNESFIQLLQNRYDRQRLGWLVTTVAGMTLLYLSSEEIWKIADKQPFPEMCPQFLVLYSIIFGILALIIHFLDLKKTIKDVLLAFSVSFFSLLIDLFVIMFFEFIILYTIQVIPKDLISVLSLLSIGAFPSCLGVVTISSITSDYLKKRAEKLYKEIRLQKEKLDDLSNKWDERYKKFKELEKKLSEYEKIMKKLEKEEKR